MSDPLPNFAPAIHLGAPETASRAASLRRTEHVFGAWGYIVPEGTDWRECLTRQYWGRVIERLSAGDTVQIQTSDHRVWFEMLILYVNSATDPVTFDDVFRPVHPSDLQLPAFAKQRPPRFEVRTFPGGDGSWCVVDLRTGDRPHENGLRRQAALELAAQLERSAAETEAELAGDHRDREPAEAPAAPPRPAAAEGAYHLHDVGGGEWQVHGPNCAVIVAGLEDREAAERVCAALSPPMPAETVMMVALKEARPRPRPRGRPRKPAPGRSPEASPPMAAASTEA